MPVETRSGRERIVDTAAALFYEHGFHAVGVDLIVAQSGVAKTTLYRHFRSKDDLIVAYLQRANSQFWAWFDGALKPRASPRNRLVGLFDAVEKLATDPACLGCTFQVTAAEFPERGHPGHATALAHKEGLRSRLHELAAQAGASDPAGLGDALLLLMDGAFAAARMYGPESPAVRVARAARRSHRRVHPDPPSPSTAGALIEMFDALDFIYVPTADVDAATVHHVEILGAELLWKIRAMGTTVAALRLSPGGPQVLLSGHLEGERPILVYRVPNYADAVAALRGAGLTGIEELDIPHGPCAAFHLDSGQRYAIYECTRPEADSHFAGRIDP